MAAYCSNAQAVEAQMTDNDETQEPIERIHLSLPQNMFVECEYDYITGEILVYGKECPCITVTELFEKNMSDYYVTCNGKSCFDMLFDHVYSVADTKTSTVRENTTLKFVYEKPEEYDIDYWISFEEDIITCKEDKIYLMTNVSNRCLLKEIIHMIKILNMPIQTLYIEFQYNDKIEQHYCVKI